MLAGPTLVWGSTQKRAIQAWQAADHKAARTRLSLLSKARHAPEQLDQELPNLRGTINWLVGQQNDQAGQLLLSYLEELAPFLHLRGRDAELERWCLDALDTCKRLRQNPAKILLMLGECQYALGHWQQAGTNWQSAVEQSEGTDESLHAQTVFALGRLQLNQGEYKAALRTLAQAEKLYNDLGDAVGAIEVRSEIAAYFLNRRELDKALSLYLEIESFQKKRGGLQTPDHTLLMLGVVYRQKRMFDKAIDYLTLLHERGEAQGNAASTATSAHHLAWAFLELGELEDARRLCGQAIALYEDIQDPRGLSDAYEQMGAILIEEDRPSEALIPLEQSVQMRRRLGNQPGQLSSMRRLALVHLLNGEPKRVPALVARILQIYAQSGMLSRSRLLALLRDFARGMRKAIALRLRQADGPDEAGRDQPGDNSVMEKFSRVLFKMWQR